MRFRPHYSRSMPPWLIPMLYTVASVTAGLILPRLEHAYFAGYSESISVGSALAFFSSVSSGMMALTAIVFAIAFVLVQFSALAYSPRLAIMFASGPFTWRRPAASNRTRNMPFVCWWISLSGHCRRR